MVRGSEGGKDSLAGYTACRKDMGELVDRIDTHVLVVAGSSDIIEPVERMRTEVRDRVNGTPSGKATLSNIERLGSSGAVGEAR